MALLTLKVQLLTKAALSPVLKYACINCANAGPTTICSVWKGIIIKQQNSYCGHKISVLNSLIDEKKNKTNKHINKQKQHDSTAVMFMNINLWAQDMKQPNKRSVPLLLDFPLGLLFVHWVLPDGCVCLLIHFLHLRKRCILEYSKTVTRLITSPFITYVSACFTVRSC